MRRLSCLTNQRGSSLILAVCGTVVLLGMMTVLCNFGYLAYNKTQLQTAADAAALAGGHVLAADPASPALKTTATNRAKDLVTANAPDATANAAVSIIYGEPTPPYKTMKVVVTLTRTVHGLLYKKDIHATATAQLFPGRGINAAPNIVIAQATIDKIMKDPSALSQQYSMVMQNPLSQYYTAELGIKNSFDYADIVFDSDPATANAKYYDDCAYSRKALNTDDKIYYWAHSSAGTTAIDKFSSRLDQSKSQSDKLYGQGKYPVWDDTTQQYNPPIQSGDPRMLTYPIVASLPDKNLPEGECQVLDDLKIQNFVGFVIDEVDKGKDKYGNIVTEQLPQNWQGWTQYYTAYPLHQIKGHFVRIASQGVATDPNGSIFTGLGTVTVQLVKNDHPENDY